MTRNAAHLDKIHNLDERREKRRHLLKTKVQVRNACTREYIGLVANLHEDGLMLMGAKLVLNGSYQVELLLPGHIFSANTLDLGIECLWLQSLSSEDNLYCCGCAIIDKSPFVESCIQSLISIKSAS